MDRTNSLIRRLPSLCSFLYLLSFQFLNCQDCQANPCPSCEPYYGATLSAVVSGKEPLEFRAYQLMLNYDPQLFQWRRFNVYFDGGLSQLWVTKSNCAYYRTVTIYSAAPVIRYTFRQWHCIHPFLEMSIGLAYLNHTHFAKRNLGIHFSFQDRMGVGMFIGSSQQFSVGLHSVHYSNAHLSNHNSGITALVVLDLGYRFQ